MKQNKTMVMDREPEISLPCILARSATYLTVPAGEGMDCALAAARTSEDAED